MPQLRAKWAKEPGYLEHQQTGWYFDFKKREEDSVKADLEAVMKRTVQEKWRAAGTESAKAKAVLAAGK